MSRSVRCLIPVAVAAVAAVAATGCGSSDAETTASTQTTGGGAAAAEAAQAKAALAPFLRPPTRLTVSTPLKAKPEAGQTLTYLQCDAAQCKVIGDAMREAATAAGWRYKVLNYQLANPASLTGAMRQSLQDRPVAVAFNASPYAVWKSQVPAFRKAGTALIPMSLGPAEVDDTVIANLNGPPYTTESAEIVANWFIADSGGTGKAVLYSVPDLPTLKVYQDAFLAKVKAGCRGCRVTLVTQTVPDALGGKSNGAIVSALQRERDTGYVILSNYPLTVGLPSSLEAAGIDGVKIGGSYTGRADGQLIKQGLESAGTPQPLAILGWQAVDAAARHAQGMEVPDEDGGLPNQLLTPDTPFTPSDSYDEPSDYQQQFKTLWHVG